MVEPNSTEIMTIVASRMLRDRVVCFVGIGIPSKAANLARLTHAPGAVLIYESGTIGSVAPAVADVCAARASTSSEARARIWSIQSGSLTPSAPACGSPLEFTMRGYRDDGPA